jgi:hypothetical protein
MMKKLLLFLMILPPFISMAQEEEKSYGIKFSGYVKTDAFYDSRQTVSIREGHFLLWPAAESLDPDNKDINDKSNFNILSIQTRLLGKITGPDAFGAKTSGLIEADFFGNENSSFSDVNGFRLRHAFVKLNWEKTELLIGQFWHPMFVTDCYPGVISFNTGAPFQPFSRNPQIKVTRKMGTFKVILAVQSQRDFANRFGVSGTATSTYLRNSGIPDMQFQVHYAPDPNFIAGVGGGYKILVPQIKSSAGYQTREKISALSGLAFLKIKLDAVTIKAEGVYGQNACDYLLPGGFAVKDTNDYTRNLVEYTPISAVSAWTDIQTNGKTVQAGIFAGYAKNLGSKDDINGPVFGLGTDIAQIFRVSPRIIVNSGKFSVAAELEYTSAAYGTRDIKAVPKNTVTVGNIRILLAAYYYF